MCLNLPSAGMAGVHPELHWLSLSSDYRILEGNPVTKVYLARWLKIWKSINYTTKHLTNISIDVLILKDTTAILLLLWIEPRALWMVIVYFITYDSNLLLADIIWKYDGSELLFCNELMYKLPRGAYLTQQYNSLTVLEVSSHYVHYIAQANLILADIYHHAWAPQIRFF